MVLGDLSYAAAALLGVTALGQALGEFVYLLRILGAIYLIWLGIRLWIVRPEALQVLPSAPDRGGLRDIGAGLFLCLGNPKVILFYAGFLPAFMDLTHLSPVDRLSVLGTVALVVGSVLLGNAVLASRARRWISNIRAVRLLNRCSGAVLVGAGITLVSTE
jgi:threonine/homoserine/homoserine lactone efflux protein